MRVAARAGRSGLGQVVLRRLALLGLVLVGVSVLTFLISHAIPGDPARLLAGQRASEEVVSQIRARYGLDQPLPVQYARYVSGLLQGDLGAPSGRGARWLKTWPGFSRPPWSWW